MKKTCSRCHQEKDLSEFHTGYNKRSGKSYPLAACKACSVIISREYYHNKIKGTDRVKNRSSESDRYVANKILNAMRKRCKTKGWDEPEFTAAEIYEVIKEGNKCAITGIPFQNTLNLDHGIYNGLKASPDRIDNSKGYTKDNVQWVVAIYNMMKGNFPEEHLEIFIKALVKKYEHLS